MTSKVIETRESATRPQDDRVSNDNDEKKGTRGTQEKDEDEDEEENKRKIEEEKKVTKCHVTEGKRMVGVEKKTKKMLGVK